MEIEDAMKAQERLKVIEIEARQLNSNLSDSQSKVVQLEQNTTVTGKKLDDLTTNIPAWTEKEAVLQDQLAAAEFRAKIAEEKFEMQTEILQREIKMRAMKDDELNNGRATFDKKEIDFIRLTEMLQDLESQSKSSHHKSEDHEKLAKLKKEMSVKEIEGTAKLEKLYELSEPRTKQVEHVITPLQEDPQLFPGSVFSSKKTGLKQAETNVSVPEKELEQSQEQIYELGQYLNTDETLIDSKDKLPSVELELKSVTPREIELQTKLRVYEEQLTAQESIINQTTIRCMELEELLQSQVKDTETKFQEAKEAFMCAVTAAKRLHEKLSPLEMQGKQSEKQAAQASTSFAGSQVNGLRKRTQAIARSLFLSLRCKTERMLEDEKVFAHDARTSSSENYIKHSNFSLNFILGVALLSVLIGFIIGKH